MKRISLESILRIIDRRSIPFAANYLSGRPFYASFDVTNYCNLQCEGCDYPLLAAQRRLGRDLPLSGIERRIENLHDAFGSLIVVLAGFEPTVRRDLPEIITSASKRNYVGIVTNGTLIREESAEKYWDSGLVFAAVSIPAFDDNRFKAITKVPKYGINDVQQAIETLIQASKGRGFVAVAVTIDNLTTPEEMRAICQYAANVGAYVSFQPYASSKPASAAEQYDPAYDKRAITVSTLENVFGGNIADTIAEMKAEYPNIVGRQRVLRNFDLFVKTGSIPFQPRSLKIYTDGDVALYPEGPVFSNIDKPPRQVWNDYLAHVQSLTDIGLPRANNCYRCVNVTNTTSILDLLRSI